eukprot:TRINITY_DN1139_c0_g2_i1.p1 TRINITY_DN1139_c0_g2~~TRINITY_DN1139_c0_g2_i1.p1  ORF type:complete len:726 (-),score=155.78 TRINITY_DN1139_c0_g2_i1:11-2188(-)
MIPPPGWINTAHQNGVKVLGTFITEWGPGESENLELINGREGNKYFYADKLIEIARVYKFDGWFFNFESKFPDEETTLKLVDFLSYFRQKIHVEIEGSISLWYDSILQDGQLKWQNELNSKNEIFFGCSDGFFMNYQWNEEKLQNSVNLAGSRKSEVYAGIDIFGRNTFGGGGYDTCKALDVICSESKRCSVGLFAPAWTFEVHAKDDRLLFDKHEEKYWEGQNFVDILAEDKQKWNFSGKLGKSGFSRVNPQDSYNGRSSKAVCTSFTWSERFKVLDLVKLGFSVSELDSSPPIIVSEWYAGNPPNTEDFYRMDVKLLDKHQKELLSWSSGELRTSASWKQISKKIVGYPAGVRYILFQDAGKDAEGWGGHFGAKIDAPSILVYKSQKFASISEYIAPRFPKMELPFRTSFNTGIGKKYCKEGQLVSSSSWNNIGHQEILPSTLNNIISGGRGHVELDYDNAYNGGSSLIFFPGRSGYETPNFSEFRLFETGICVPPSVGNLRASFSVLFGEENSTSLSLKLVWSNGTQHILRAERRVKEKKEEGGEEKKYEEGREDKGRKVVHPRKSKQEGSWTTFSFLFTPPPSPSSIVFIDAVVSSFASPFAPAINLGQIRIEEQRVKEGKESSELQRENMETKYSLSWNTASVERGEEVADVTLEWKDEEGHARYNIWNSEKTELLGVAFTKQFVIRALNFSQVREYLFFVQPVSYTRKQRFVAIVVKQQ